MLIEAYSTVKLVNSLPVIVYCRLKAFAVSRVTLTVPVPVRVPAPLMTLEGSGVKVELAPIVKVCSTLKLDDVLNAAESAIVKL